MTEFREERRDRFRLVFEAGDRRFALVASLDAVQPWIGRPAVPRDLLRPQGKGPFAAAVARHLGGRRITEAVKPWADCILVLGFGGGGRLVAELSTHGPNLVLLNAEGRVVATARHPRRSSGRLEPEAPYQPPSLPAGRFVPFGTDPEELESFLRRTTSAGEDAFEALTRRAFGVGTEGARLVVAEAVAGGRSVSAVLVERLRALAEGRTDPVIVGPEDPVEDARAGRLLEAARIRLLPWDPGPSLVGGNRVRREDAAGTAGLYYDALETARRVEGRAAAVRSVVRSELRRLWDAERKIEGDIEGLSDADQRRLWGEALLAGLASARRAGPHVFVSDPYDPEGREIAVPADPGSSIQAAAEAHFRRSRRARRGIEMARRRREAVRARAARLERISAQAEGARGEEAVSSIVEALRAEGIPIGLAPATRAGAALARAQPPRVEGVRMQASSDGLTILVGRSGPDNDRLTFKLSAPDDFWFHAAGVAGAHVVVRNPRRLPRPPAATIEEAASLAAWFSDAREAAQTEVHWTRRKNVRRVRGASPGTVTLKRWESVRARPVPLAGLEGGGG